MNGSESAANPAPGGVPATDPGGDASTGPCASATSSGAVALVRSPGGEGVPAAGGDTGMGPAPASPLDGDKPNNNATTDATTVSAPGGDGPPETDATTVTATGGESVPVSVVLKL